MLRLRAGRDRGWHGFGGAGGGEATDGDRLVVVNKTGCLFGSEFGRTPLIQGSSGRNHNAAGFTVWLAGGGVRPVDPRKKIWTGCCLLEINLVPLSRLSIN